MQISDSGISDLAGAIVAGSPITIVGTTYPYQFFRLYGRKGMTSPAELKGKTIAASSAGSASTPRSRPRWRAPACSGAATTR